MKTYSNRYASMEQQSDGRWIVFSELSGLPITNGGTDDPDKEIKFFTNYKTARAAMIELTQRGQIIESGR